ncbi:MAG: arylsulfatase, partial [Verrucomicrobiales bacterium]|nr:arylsulfatase [Verrucomicrobiales bacterium]
TILELAGVDYPEGDFENGRKPLPLDGISFVPALRGDESATGHEELFFSVPAGEAVRIGKWKLVNPRRDRPWELYDLEADGTETKNLAGEFPDRVEQMAEAFRKWKKEVGD